VRQGRQVTNGGIRRIRTEHRQAIGCPHRRIERDARLDFGFRLS
jgi:hypothetical protein